MTARDQETALRNARQAAKLVRRKVKEHDDRVSLGFWHATANGAVNQERAIEAQDWTQLRGTTRRRWPGNSSG